MRQVVTLIVLAITASGCAVSNDGSPRDMANAAASEPAFAAPATGSLLSARHRVGALPIDVYDADALRRQGITSAAGAVQQVPQNSGR